MVFLKWQLYSACRRAPGGGTWFGVQHLHAEKHALPPPHPLGQGKGLQTFQS